MPWVVNECGRRGAAGAGREFFVSIGFVTWVLVRPGGYSRHLSAISVRFGELPEVAASPRLLRVPDAAQRAWRCSAEPGPTDIAWTPDQQRTTPQVRRAAQHPGNASAPAMRLPSMRKLVNCAAARRRRRRTRESG